MTQATKYWIHEEGKLGNLPFNGQITEYDRWPTLHYYGTLTLASPVENPEDYGLVLYTEDSADREAEANALYRAETRC